MSSQCKFLRPTYPTQVNNLIKNLKTLFLKTYKHRNDNFFWIIYLKNCWNKSDAILLILRAEFECM